MNQGVNIPISLSNSDDFDDIVDDSDEQFDASALVLDSAVDNTDKEVPMPMFSDAPASNPIFDSLQPVAISSIIAPRSRETPVSASPSVVAPSKRRKRSCKSCKKVAGYSSSECACKECFFFKKNYI